MGKGKKSWALWSKFLLLNVKKENKTDVPSLIQVSISSKSSIKAHIRATFQMAFSVSFLCFSG